MYDPPSLPSTFKYPNKTIRSEDNNNQQTSNRYYDPFNYTLNPHSNTNIQTDNIQNPIQSNNNPNFLTHHSYTQPLPTNSTQTNSSHETKGYYILTLYNLLKDDSKILHFRIYQMTPYIK